MAKTTMIWPIRNLVGVILAISAGARNSDREWRLDSGKKPKSEIFFIYTQMSLFTLYWPCRHLGVVGVRDPATVSYFGIAGNPPCH
jgi:hypothetical protein